MSIPTLFNIPEGQEAWLRWSFENMDHHRSIVSAALSQKKTTLTLAPLDPITFQDIEAWAIQHQLMHTEFTGLLGIPGSDFTTVNLSDPDQLASWIFLHANEHLQADKVLRIDG